MASFEPIGVKSPQRVLEYTLSLYVYNCKVRNLFLKDRKRIAAEIHSFVVGRRNASLLTTRSTLHVGLAMCGSKTDYTVLKSVLLFTEERLHFHIIMQEEYRARLVQKVR